MSFFSELLALPGDMQYLPAGALRDLWLGFGNCVLHFACSWGSWTVMLPFFSSVLNFPLEKEMATHSSSLAWEIPWTEEPGRLQFMGSQRVRHDWVTEHIEPLLPFFASILHLQVPLPPHFISASVAHSSPTLCDPMDYIPPCSLVHRILLARTQAWVPISLSRGSPQPRDWTWVSCITGRFFTVWATSSVQFSHSVVSVSLWPHELQHTRPPCPLPTPGVIQTHVHWVGDAIQPSHPLSSPSPPALNLSQRQGLFKWVSSLHQVAKILEFQLQHQSFQWTLGTHLL